MWKEDERSDDGDRPPENAIVGQHFNGKLEWHCEEDRQRGREKDCLSDSPSSSHLPHLESKLAPFKCV